MIKIFIKSNDDSKDKFIEVNTAALSVYSLKLTILYNSKNLGYNLGSIDDFTLTYNGQILKDNKSLLEYEITNNSTVFINQELKGGSTLDVLIIIALILSFLLINVLLLSGILFFLSNGFSYGLASALKYFINLSAPNSFIGSILKFLKTVLVLFINLFSNVTFLFFMVFIWFFVVYFKKANKYCDSLGAAFNTSMWICIAFLITFVVFAIRPLVNFFLKRKFGEDTPIGFVRKIFNTIFGFIESVSTTLISLIPFYGSYYAFMSVIVSTASAVIAKLGKARDIEESMNKADNLELLKVLHKYLCAYTDKEKLGKKARDILSNPDKILEEMIRKQNKNITNEQVKNKLKSYNFIKECNSSSNTITQSVINQVGLDKLITNIYKIVILRDFYDKEFKLLSSQPNCYQQYNPFNSVTYNYYMNVVVKYPIYNNLLKIGTKILINIYNMYYGRSDYENRGEVYDEGDILQLFRATSLAGFISFIVFLVLAIWKGIFGKSAAGYKYVN